MIFQHDRPSLRLICRVLPARDSKGAWVVAQAVDESRLCHFPRAFIAVDVPQQASVQQ